VNSLPISDFLYKYDVCEGLYIRRPIKDLDPVDIISMDKEIDSSLFSFRDFCGGTCKTCHCAGTDLSGLCDHYEVFLPGNLC
jgi:hypothetical protein